MCGTPVPHRRPAPFTGLCHVKKTDDILLIKCVGFSCLITTSGFTRILYERPCLFPAAFYFQLKSVAPIRPIFYPQPLRSKSVKGKSLDFSSLHILIVFNRPFSGKIHWYKHPYYQRQDLLTRCKMRAAWRYLAFIEDRVHPIIKPHHEQN